MSTVYYTAFDNMQKYNNEQLGEIIKNVTLGPFQPKFYKKANNEMDLESAAIQFIHTRCVGLRFDPKKEDEYGKRDNYTGKSGKQENSIPYNMQMDIDRLTFEKALERFIESGTKDDAFDVYFCYLEMFVGSYGKCNRMIELLSEFENNGSSLLMKHRDHYSHSVYVFALGLAIYETNAYFRKAYNDYYNKALVEGQTIDHHFLQYWGLTALFHDIGYPFELPFEQVESYFEERGSKEDRSRVERRVWPFIAYKNIDNYIAFSEIEAQQQGTSIYNKLSKLYNSEEGFSEEIDSTEKLFAFELERKLGTEYDVSYADVLKKLHSKPADPEKNGHFMDHAYFSATVLFRELNENVDQGEGFNQSTIDALTAILLHNSLFKFGITNYKKILHPFKKELHPLAYMLMLCDEIQCWDRTSYGRNSRTQCHPANARFSFRNNGIQVTYIYDENDADKIKEYKDEYRKALEKGVSEDDLPEMKAFSTMVDYQREIDGEYIKNTFLSDIEKIVAINQENELSLDVCVDLEAIDYTRKKVFLSESSFIHLYYFAVALNAQYEEATQPVEVYRQDFDELSLEYKLSNILQAKEFASHLNQIGCFYTDRAVNFELKKFFDVDELVTMGIREHARWDAEKIMMAWEKADSETTKLFAEKKVIREQLRMHNLIDTAFESLPKEEQLKDQRPLNTMMEKLREFDGIRIYKL